jgi:secreted trypsin-like serine protease
MNTNCPEEKLTSDLDLETKNMDESKTSMELVIQGVTGDGDDMQHGETKTSPEDDQDIEDATAKNGSKCGMKYRLIALGGVLLVATVTALSVVLVPKPKPLPDEIEPVPLTHLAAYEPISPSRIIGGSEASKGDWPYVVFLLDELGYGCGGSLIAKDVVLTAASCSSSSTYYAFLGVVDINEPFDEAFTVTTEVLHPNYSGETALGENNFMLLFLDGPSAAETVKLNSYASVPTVGQDVWTMGWGDTDIANDFDPDTTFDTSYSPVLNHIEVQVLSNEDCDSSGGYIGDNYFSYTGYITDDMLCAQDDGQGFCDGDVGGPLVIHSYDGDTQVGIASSGLGCAEEPFPNVYARVSEAYDWIRGEVCARSNYATEAGFDCDSYGDDDQPPNSQPTSSDPCVVCPNGVTVSDDFVIDPEYGLTCQDFVDYGLYYETDGSDTCDGLKSWEALCCPTVDDPCTFCANGVSSGYEDFIPYPEYGNTYPCKDMVYFAAAYESDSEMCGYFELLEQSCCA